MKMEKGERREKIEEKEKFLATFEKNESQGDLVPLLCTWTEDTCPGLQR